jgi:hypothetical protein
MNHSSNTITFFEEVLNEKKCIELAKEHKFVQRSSSKLKGYEFIKALTIPSAGLSTDSLKGLCSRMQEFNPEAELSAQALCERINDVSAKELMRGVYASILSYVQTMIADNPYKLKALEKFNTVLIQDSTVMKLNERLQENFEGTNRGGTGAKSQVKIDLIYNLMKGTVIITRSIK